MNGPRVSVIIVNYNAGRRLQKCLDHLAAQSFKDFETIIIDNGSTDGSLKSISEHPLSPILIEAGKNLGFAAGNNQAVQRATGEWLAFLNPDAYADERWLSSLMTAVQRYPQTDAFGSKQIDANDPSRADGLGDICHALGLVYRGGFGASPTQVMQDGECFSPCAAAALYRREVFQALGGFDERFFCYGEDVDLGFRLRLNGGRSIQVANAVVAHEGSGVTGRYSDFSVYHGNRNRIWLYYKNLPVLLLWVLTPIHLFINLAMLARAYSAGYGSAYWRGVRDGYRGLGDMRARRKETQNARKAPTLMIAQALTWSPIKMLRREIDLRFLSD